MLGTNSIYLLVLLSASAQATSPVSPHKQVIEVLENYKASPWYLGKIKLAADGPYDTELVGNDEGIFHFDPETGFLQTNQSFDREKQEFYTLQVIARGNEEAVIDSVTVQIIIKDANDNQPMMTHKTFHGVISKGSGQGVAFMHVQATDEDDPMTDNADLRYSILPYNSAPYKDMFQVESRTGAVSLTEQGATTLPELQEAKFKFVVQVKDTGDEPLGNKDTANLEIDVAENTWVTPSPVTLPENLKCDYPRVISQVRWNSTEVQYHLAGNFAEGLFTIDDTGNIYVTRELDREIESQHQIEVSAVNFYNISYSDPLQISVIVLDENDNKPVFSANTYHVEITEKMTRGSVLLHLHADDADEMDTINTQISYRIVSQEPSTPENVFAIDEKNGDLTLQDSSLWAGNTKTYQVEITATDLAGSQDGLSSSCLVIIDVMDINDNPPVFLENKFAPFIIPENTEPGVIIATLTATDEDHLPVNKLIDFYVQSGNEDGTFRILTDQESNTISVYLDKVLDYEKKQEYDLIFLAKNKAELFGTEYGASSTATVHVTVQNVNEPPVFDQRKYEVQILESTQSGSVILTAEAKDPDILHPAKLHYSIKNDSRKWLSVKEHSGKIHLLHAIDREVSDETYTVQVVVTEEGDHGLSASAEIVMHIVDVNDNIPFLVGDYSKAFFCSNKVDTQRILIKAYDLDSGQNGAPFTFQVVNDPNVQVKWKITHLNETHAYLSMVISYLEPKVYYVPIIVSDSGEPTQSQRVHLPVSVCQCGSSNQCIGEVNKMENMPTVSTAMGTLFGTLGAIVLILIIIFLRLSLFSSPKNLATSDSIPLKNAV
ncbi:cadherin-16 [Pelobates fuscus]|uniref:cadherin-16 n=1 Tax=Pelobates fuscus TaxID=191477 RepID=UPI002FE481AD